MKNCYVGIHYGETFNEEFDEEYRMYDVGDNIDGNNDSFFVLILLKNKTMFENRISDFVSKITKDEDFKDHVNANKFNLDEEYVKDSEDLRAVFKFNDTYCICLPVVGEDSIANRIIYEEKFEKLYDFLNSMENIDGLNRIH